MAPQHQSALRKGASLSHLCQSVTGYRFPGAGMRGREITSQVFLGSNSGREQFSGEGPTTRGCLPVFTAAGLREHQPQEVKGLCPGLPSSREPYECHMRALCNRGALTHLRGYLEAGFAEEGLSQAPSFTHHPGSIQANPALVPACPAPRPRSWSTMT